MKEESVNSLSNNEEINSYISDLEIKSSQLFDLVKETNEKMGEYYLTLPKEKKEDDKDTEENIASLKRSAKNLQKAYHTSYQMCDEFSVRWKDTKNQSKIIPTNSMVDVIENESLHFAKGLNIYKLLWICFAGSVVGVIIELLWCLFRNGYLEGRSGLVYGPFNLLYGAGGIALTLCLYRYRNRGSWMSFVGGFLTGSVLEYFCSWGQEMAFGSRSWNYSDMPFNINGRICLLYSFFWGFLGVLWIKKIYPLIAKMILKIPNKTGKIITWIVAAFFIFNIIMTILSVFRWTQRLDGIEASNSFWQWFDTRFPNERMERVFANMKFNN